MTELTLYDRAKTVLAQYERVDEVKDFRDKAKAMEQYAKEANDMELEIAASKARLRAERKWGEMYSQSQKAVGATGNKSNQYQKEVRSYEATTPTLADMNVSKDQSSTWQKLAEIPEDEYEELLETNVRAPTASSILKARAPAPEPPRISQSAVFLYGETQGAGTMGEFIRQYSLRDVLATMPDEMLDRTNGFINELQEWLNE